MTTSHGMRIGRGREFSRTHILAGSGIDKLDKNKIAAMTTEMKATKGMVATSKIFNVFFSKAGKEGDSAGVRDQLLPIQTFMRKHALAPEQLEDDVREAYLDALCMK